VAIYNQDSPPIASQMILDEVMPGVLNMHYFDSLESAIDSVKANENWAGKSNTFSTKFHANKLSLSFSYSFPSKLHQLLHGKSISTCTRRSD